MHGSSCGSSLQQAFYGVGQIGEKLQQLINASLFRYSGCILALLIRNVELNTLAHSVFVAFISLNGVTHGTMSCNLYICGCFC
jgi:hypothetical protein